MNLPLLFRKIPAFALLFLAALMLSACQPAAAQPDPPADAQPENPPAASPVPSTAVLAAPTETAALPQEPTPIPTALPVDPASYDGWWTYTHTGYHFTLLLPEDWIVEEVTTGDALLNGHLLNLHPGYASGTENIRLTFRQAGEETRLWPSGVGQGEFIAQGTLDIAGQPAQRVLLVCPGGEITSIWYHQAEGEPNLARGELEFGFIFTAGPHCEAGRSLGGKVQPLGEMIIASLRVEAPVE